MNRIDVILNNQLIKDDDVIYLLRNIKQGYTKASPKQLGSIMTFLKVRLTTERGNWSIKKFESSFINEFYNELECYYKLDEFYKCYVHRRLRPIKKFEHFLNSINVKQIRKNKGQNKKNFKIRPKGDIEDFIKEIKNLKYKYLEGTNKNMIELIDSNVITGLSKSTLRNKYYKKY